MTIGIELNEVLTNAVLYGPLNGYSFEAAATFMLTHKSKIKFYIDRKDGQFEVKLDAVLLVKEASMQPFAPLADAIGLGITLDRAFADLSSKIFACFAKHPDACLKLKPNATEGDVEDFDAFFHSHTPQSQQRLARICPAVA